MYLKPAQPPASTMMRSPSTSCPAPAIAERTAFTALSVSSIIVDSSFVGNSVPKEIATVVPDDLPSRSVEYHADRCCTHRCRVRRYSVHCRENGTKARFGRSNGETRDRSATEHARNALSPLSSPKQLSKSLHSRQVGAAQRDEAFQFAERAIEEFLPFHIVGVARGEASESSSLIRRVSSSRSPKTEVLPQMARRHRAPRDNGGDPTAESARTSTRKCVSKLMELLLFLVQRDRLGLRGEIEEIARGRGPLIDQALRVRRDRARAPPRRQIPARGFDQADRQRAGEDMGRERIAGRSPVGRERISA